ncbi:MAG: hypothetical protein J6V23_06940 [Bacteroidaceae bacterium]|nr:hypothetical protein [Bacteroidaceae bacterium]
MLPRILEYINTLEDDKEYEVVIDKLKKKRSNDANAYYWQLIGQLSAKINVPTREIYRTHIKDVGDNFEIVPIREIAVEAWINAWESRGLGWCCECLGESKMRDYMNVICFYGSSTYDTRQMSRLIELCVADCKEQGIETMTPQELASLMQGYKENENGK